MQNNSASRNYFNMEVMKYWSYPSNTKFDKHSKTETLIKSGAYIGARKVDGEHARYVRQNGEIGILSRTRGVDGNFANKIDKVPHIAKWLNKVVPDNSILVGELYLRNNSNSSDVGAILRCLTPKALERQKKKEDKLMFYIFDIWAWDGEEYFDWGIEQRIEKLNEVRPSLENEYITFAEYSDGEQLWNNIEDWLQSGEEGAVATKKTCKVYEKRTPAYDTIKIKKELLKDIDVFFTGVAKPPIRQYTGKYVDIWELWENEFTGEKLPIGLHYKEYIEGATILPVTKGHYYNIPGSFEIGVFKDNKVYPIGWISGVTDDIKDDFIKNPIKYKMKPCRVSAMEIGNEGGLRHPKFMGFRDDISVQDCTYEKIFG